MKTPQQLADEKAMEIAEAIVHLESAEHNAKIISTHLLPLYEGVEALRKIEEQLQCPSRNTTMSRYRRDGSVIISHDLRTEATKALSNLSTPTTKKKEGE